MKPKYKEDYFKKYIWKLQALGSVSIAGILFCLSMFVMNVHGDLTPPKKYLLWVLAAFIFFLMACYFFRKADKEDDKMYIGKWRNKK